MFHHKMSYVTCQFPNGSMSRSLASIVDMGLKKLLYKDWLPKHLLVSTSVTHFNERNQLQQHTTFEEVLRLQTYTIAQKKIPLNSLGFTSENCIECIELYCKINIWDIIFGGKNLFLSNLHCV